MKLNRGAFIVFVYGFFNSNSFCLPINNAINVSVNNSVALSDVNGVMIAAKNPHQRGNTKSPRIYFIEA